MGVSSARPTQPGPAGGGSGIPLQWAPRGRRFTFVEGFELLLQRAAGIHPAAPQLHHQGGCGFKTLSELTRRRSATPQDFVLNTPPPKKGDSPVSNGDISFPNYSGSSWLRKAWGCGERGGGREEPDCKGKTAPSLPHTGMLLLNFRTAPFGPCWQIPLEENNKLSTFQKGEKKKKGTSDAIPS